MTHRERLLAVIQRQSLDQIPWVPRLLLWYNAHKKNGTLPEKYRDWSLRDIEKDLGLGTPARDSHVYKEKTTAVEVNVHYFDSETVTEYITPVGTVTTRFRSSAQLERAGLGSYEIEHIIKGPNDYAVVEYIIEHTEFIPTYDEYLAYDAEIGDDGLPLVNAADCPIHRVMREFLGYEKFFLELNDRPNKVEHLLTVLTEHTKQLQRIVAESPAIMVLHGAHFDSAMTPPPLFEKYFKPYYQDFAALLHSKGKTLVIHADADTRLLLDAVRESDIDMAECFTVAPMVSCTLADARAAWGNDVIIWGGIPSVLLCENISDEEFENFMDDLFKTIAPGDSFILGVGDNVMPEAKIERVARITEMVKERGKYPIRA